jgi:hypothetical protein
MIEIKIVITNVKSVQQIKTALLDKMLVANCYVIKEPQEIINPNFILTGQTRALLFEDVQKEVKALIADDLITIYSTPVVNADWQLLDSKLYKKKSA